MQLYSERYFGPDSLIADHEIANCREKQHYLNLTLKIYFFNSILCV